MDSGFLLGTGGRGSRVKDRISSLGREGKSLNNCMELYLGGDR